MYLDINYRYLHMYAVYIKACKDVYSLKNRNTGKHGMLSQLSLSLQDLAWKSFFLLVYLDLFHSLY